MTRPKRPPGSTASQPGYRSGDERSDLSGDATQGETGCVRLRKPIVTENLTTTVPVSCEEVRKERIETDGDEGLRGNR